MSIQKINLKKKPIHTLENPIELPKKNPITCNYPIRQLLIIAVGGRFRPGRVQRDTDLALLLRLEDAPVHVHRFRVRLQQIVPAQVRRNPLYSPCCVSWKTVLYTSTASAWASST